MKSLTLLSLYIGVGVLLGVGFLYPSFWFLGLAGVVGQLWLLAKHTNHQILGSFLAWTIKFLFVLGFYWSIYPIRWLPFEFGAGELVLIALYWITVALFLGLGGAVFGFVYRYVSRAVASTGWLHYFAIPIVWVLAEIAGSFLLSVFTLGPGSELNTYFSLGYVGLLFAQHPLLLSLAHFGGVYILSFVTVVVAIGLVRRLRIRLRLVVSTFCVSLLLLLTSVMQVGNVKVSSDVTTVAVVSTYFPVQELFNREALPALRDMQEAALQAAIETDAAYIILPEDARFFDQSEDPEKVKATFQFTRSGVDTIIVDSSRVEYGSAALLQGFIFDTSSNEHSIVHKQYLVPQGEFVPYIYEALFRTIGFGFLMDELESLLSYTIGPYTSQADLPAHYPGVLFCFESASGVGVRNLLSERPGLPFVAHPVSHSWFNSPESFWSQLDAALRVQAVWNDIAIVSAGNHAPSQVFLPNGTIVEPETVASGEYWSVGVVTVPLK